MFPNFTNHEYEVPPTNFIDSAQSAAVWTDLHTYHIVHIEAQDVESAEKDSNMSFLVLNLDISSLSASVTLMYPYLASCPQTAPAALVVIATAL